MSSSLSLPDVDLIYSETISCSPVILPLCRDSIEIREEDSIRDTFLLFLPRSLGCFKSVMVGFI